MEEMLPNIRLKASKRDAIGDSLHKLKACLEALPAQPRRRVWLKAKGAFDIKSCTQGCLHCHPIWPAKLPGFTERLPYNCSAARGGSTAQCRRFVLCL